MEKFFLFFMILFVASTTKAVDPTVTSFSCDYAPTPQGERIFGMDILNQTQNGSYTEDLERLNSLKGSFQTLHLTWSGIEGTGSGSTSGAFTDPSDALASFESIASTHGIKLALTIRPIDATGKTVPSDLSSARLNNAAMKTRFRRLLDYVLTKISAAHLTAIMVGNEIDGYDPGSDTNFWDDYGDFLNDAHAYVSATYPTLKLGFTAR